MEKFIEKTSSIDVMLKILSGKWKTLIIYNLLDGTKRFGELKKSIPGITQRMLTNQLRELEQDKLVYRNVYPQIPPKVEYSLTAVGLGLKPILEELEQWGRCYIDKHLSK